MSDLLAALQEAVFDPAIFILNDTPDDHAMAEQIRSFLAHMYAAARNAWRFPLREEKTDPWNEPEPEYSSHELFGVFELPVFGFPVAFRKAIAAVAARPGIAGTDDERFLWFMEGYLMAGSEQQDPTRKLLRAFARRSADASPVKGEPSSGRPNESDT
jgi:hypothetical protein